MALTYLEPPYTVSIRETAWQRAGLRQTASGYGRKLNTGYMLTRPGETRPRRIYAICDSNAATYYVLIKGAAVYLRGNELSAAQRDAAGV